MLSRKVMEGWMIDESSHLCNLLRPRDISVERVEVTAWAELSDADAFFVVPVHKLLLLKVWMKLHLVDSRYLGSSG